jgi:chromosome segregation ATPase
MILGDKPLISEVILSQHVAAIGDPEFPTHHVGWALTARYAQHVSSLL